MRILITGGVERLHERQLDQVWRVLQASWGLSQALLENLYVTHLNQTGGVDQAVDAWTRRRLDEGPYDHGSGILVLENEFSEPYTSRHYDLVVIFGPEGWGKGEEPITSAMRWAMQTGTPLKLVMWEEKWI